MPLEAFEGRLASSALFSLFGIGLPKVPHDTWQYVFLLNGGAAHSILHLNGHFSCDRSITPTAPDTTCMHMHMHT